MKTPHKNAELIKAWADGAEIQVLITGPTVAKPYWADCNPDWSGNGATSTYRIKSREFPKSSVTFETVFSILWPNSPMYHRSHYAPRMQEVCDEAVKQYILDTEKAS